MRHAHRLRNFVFVLAMAATPAVAGAQAPANTSSDDMVQANVRLQERLGAATAADPPLLTNADGPLVRRAFDRDALRAMPPDLRAVSVTCGAIGKTLVAYMGFAKRTAGGSDRAAVDRQAMRMQDEVSLGLAAGNICVQRSFRAADALASSLDPARPDQAREGLKQMRRGAAQAIEGSIDAVLSAGMGAKNRDLVLSAILEDAPTVAASFPQAERSALRNIVLARLPKATGADRVKLQAIARAYGASACNAVCRFAGTS